MQAEIIDQLRQVSTATVTMQLLKRGFRTGSMTGLRLWGADTARMVGPAYTLRYIPAREDLCGAPKPGEPPTAQRLAIEECPVGHILVMATEGERRCGTIGDILAERLAVRQVGGVVTDGAIRDAGVIAGIKLAVYAAATAAPASMNQLYPVEVQRPVGCAGAAVFPGDIIVGDADGVVVIPQHLSAEIARDGLEQERVERFVAREVRRGRSTLEVYPPSDTVKAEYRRWVEAGEPA